MGLKDSWKETGKEMGSAFAGLGKTLLKSARDGVDKADDLFEGKKDDAEQTPEEQAAKEAESNVFNDGTWRKTGKQLGNAFKSMGQSIILSAEAGCDKIDETVDSVKKKDQQDQAEGQDQQEQ